MHALTAQLVCKISMWLVKHAHLAHVVAHLAHVVGEACTLGIHIHRHAHIAYNRHVLSLPYTDIHRHTQTYTHTCAQVGHIYIRTYAHSTRTVGAHWRTVRAHWRKCALHLKTHTLRVG